MNLQRLFSKVFALAALFIIASCGEDPLPTYNVGFQVSPTNPIAGETVTFTNASQGGNEFVWDFGDGNTATGADATHTYEAAGSYSVVLTPDNRDDLAFTQTVTVGEPSPTITFSPDPIEVGVAITFTADIYNPASSAVTYTWSFPIGTLGDADPTTGEATGTSVTVTFTEANSATPITVIAGIDSKSLTTTQNVNVSAQLAKTLYIGSKTGNLLTKQIYANGDAQVIDTGIPAGPHALTLDFEGDRVYVFNAGEKVAFTADAEAEVGQIFSVKYDLTEYKTHITFTSQAYDDAFFGDVTSTDIYWTDRRNDVTKMPITTENATWDIDAPDANPEAYPSLVTNNQLGYYSAFRVDGPTYGFGAVNGAFKVINGVYWWAKNSNHRGLWRFSDDDIGQTGTVPTEGELLTNYGVRTFAIDEVNQKIYFSSNNSVDNRGFYVADLPDGSNVQPVDLSPYDGEGGGNEGVFITGIVVDNESGYVYWAYRGPAAADLTTDPLHRSGIKRYKLDGTGQVEYFIEDIEAYGLALDNVKR